MTSAEAEDDEKLRDKRICAGCVGEPFLNQLIVKNGQKGNCGYCTNTDWTITLGDMAKIVDTAFQQHFVRTANEPDSMQYRMMHDPEGDYNWYREGMPIAEAISSEAQIPDEAAEEIAELLSDKYGDFNSAAMGEETEYDGDSQYDRKKIGFGDWSEDWRNFERALRTESRFFSQSATAYLSSLFGDLDRFFQLNGAPVIVEAGPGKPLAGLYRARVFQSKAGLMTALQDLSCELASPPALKAIAGRMNARGISVFYGATSSKVAVAEIRPPVGSNVVVGQFQIVRPLRLLDIRALKEIAADGSIFDPTYAPLLEKVSFLQTLEERITRPIMPDDESLDYLVTQAVADYLATSTKHPLDGLIYRSAQRSKDGENVVLFHKASRVEPFDRPEGTKVETYAGYHDEDGWVTEYRVVERVPPPRQPAPGGPLENIMHVINWEPDPNFDDRTVTLKVDPDTVTIEYIKEVEFDTKSHPVEFLRYEYKEDKDRGF